MPLFTAVTVINYPGTVSRLTSNRTARVDGDSPDYSLLGRIGAYRLHAMHDARETTKAARDKAFQRFEDEVDPQRTLDPKERRTRALAAQKAYMLRLALHSARLRRQRAAEKTSAGSPSR